MSSVSHKPKYHVVCRECSVERLFDASDDATEIKQRHAEETGHRVVVGRVQ
jgi:hypothetical protein